MSEQLQRNPSQHGIARDAISLYMPEEPQCSARKWYFSIQEIENHSPSRKDGIDPKKEAQLRKLYCSFLWELGMKLKVPQVAIATALMLCHRFYLRQSLAKNDWQIIATVSMFLACKAEETPRLLRDVIIMAYEMTYRCDPPALKRIKQREVFDKQKELILIGERLLLGTIAFDLNIEHPYKPIVDALKRMGISNNDLVKAAQNLINDWLCTTLCLQYKPHYIAAGSLFLAAKSHKVKLPTEKGKVWWLQFDVAPKQLEEVIQQMRKLLENKTQAPSPTHARMTKPTVVLGNTTSHYPQPCTARESSHGSTVGKPLVSKGSLNVAYSDSRCIVKEVIQHQTSGTSSATSVVEDGDGEIHSRTRESERNSSYKFVSIYGKYSKINANPNKENPLERRCSTSSKRSAVARGDEMYSEVCIDGDLRKGREQGYANSHKKQRRVLLGF